MITVKLSNAFLDICTNQLAKFFKDCFILSVILLSPPAVPPAPPPPSDIKIVSIINPNPKLIAVIANPYFL